MTDDVSRMSKKELEREVRRLRGQKPAFTPQSKNQTARLKIESRYYEAEEIMQIVSAVSDHNEKVMRSAMRDQTEHLLCLMELTGQLIKIHSYVARTPGKLYYETQEYGTARRVFPFTDADIGSIASELAQFMMLVERIGASVEEAPIVKTAQETMNGLRYLLNGHDDGERLRLHVSQFSQEVFNVRQWLENYPQPGRSKGSYSATTRILGERGLQLTRVQKMTISEAVNRLKEDLKGYPPDSLEGKAYAELNRRTGKKAQKYISDAISRWKEYGEEKE